MTFREIYRKAKMQLSASGVEDAAFEASCLLKKHAGITRADLPLRGAQEASVSPALWHDVDRRAAGEPLQYILGEWDFMGLTFRVGNGVLIPRPETELLAQTAIDFLKVRSSPAMLELCAGTGCISIAAAYAVQALRAWCLERYDEAAAYLRENIRLHSLIDRVLPVMGDMMECTPVSGFPCRFDMIVCNPPYIRAGDLSSLQREVLYEPREALDGGDDGLRFYRAFSPWSQKLLPGGMAAFEVGAGQADDVSAILREAGIQNIFIKMDFAGIERVVGGYKP